MDVFKSAEVDLLDEVLSGIFFGNSTVFNRVERLVLAREPLIVLIVLGFVTLDESVVVVFFGIDDDCCDALFGFNCIPNVFATLSLLKAPRFGVTLISY